MKRAALGVVVFAALNLTLGAGLCFLGFRLLFVGGWKNRLMGLMIVVAGAGLAIGGAMMIAGLDR